MAQKKLEKDAFMRLKTIEENTLLGSGYKISTRDLEIRGSGSMFGYKQSGHISSVGFQLYCDLINKEIEKVSNKGLNADVKPKFSTSLKTEINASYVGSQSFRLDFYYKISKVNTLGGLNKIEEESYETLLISSVVPEVLEVHVVPSEEVRIVPEKPTATNVLLPSYATDLRLFDVPEVCEVHVVPSDEVSNVPEAPTAINNPEELSVLLLLLLSSLEQEIKLMLKNDIRIKCKIFFILFLFIY